MSHSLGVSFVLWICFTVGVGLVVFVGVRLIKLIGGPDKSSTTDCEFLQERDEIVSKNDNSCQFKKKNKSKPATQAKPVDSLMKTSNSRTHIKQENPFDEADTTEITQKQTSTDEDDAPPDEKEPMNMHTQPSLISLTTDDNFGLNENYLAEHAEAMLETYKDIAGQTNEISKQNTVELNATIRESEDDEKNVSVQVKRKSVNVTDTVEVINDQAELSPRRRNRRKKKKDKSAKEQATNQTSPGPTENQMPQVFDTTQKTMNDNMMKNMYAKLPPGSTAVGVPAHFQAPTYMVFDHEQGTFRTVYSQPSSIYASDYTMARGRPISVDDNSMNMPQKLVAPYVNYSSDTNIVTAPNIVSDTTLSEVNQMNTGPYAAMENHGEQNPNSVYRYMQPTLLFPYMYANNIGGKQMANYKDPGNANSGNMYHPHGQDPNLVNLMAYQNKYIAKGEPVSMGMNLQHYNRDLKDTNDGGHPHLISEMGANHMSQFVYDENLIAESEGCKTEVQYDICDPTQTSLHHEEYTYKKETHSDDDMQKHTEPMLNVENDETYGNQQLKSNMVDEEGNMNLETQAQHSQAHQKLHDTKLDLNKQDFLKNDFAPINTARTDDGRLANGTTELRKRPNRRRSRRNHTDGEIETKPVSPLLDEEKALEDAEKLEAKEAKKRLARSRRRKRQKSLRKQKHEALLEGKDFETGYESKNDIQEDESPRKNIYPTNDTTGQHAPMDLNDNPIRDISWNYSETGASVHGLHARTNFIQPGIVEPPERFNSGYQSNRRRHPKVPNIQRMPQPEFGNAIVHPYPYMHNYRPHDTTPSYNTSITPGRKPLSRPYKYSPRQNVYSSPQSYRSTLTTDTTPNKSGFYSYRKNFYDANPSVPSPLPLNIASFEAQKGGNI